MPIRGSKRKVRNPEINHADPLPLAAGENSSRESSSQNGNSASGQTPSEVPAKGSGGPRTKRGKNRSSRNAVKHGIFSAVVLPEESPKMYRDILHAFCDYIKPNDRAEEILVDKLAANIWRSKRLILAESAEVYYTSGLARMETALAGSSDLKNREFNGRMLADDAHSDSLERAIELMRRLRSLIQERGFDIDADVAFLFQIYGPVSDKHLPTDVQLTYAHWRKYSKVKEANGQPEDGNSLEEAKKNAIDMIDSQIRWAEKRRECLKPFEDFRAIWSFPSEIGLEKIMRYESHLGREFDRTLQQIEHLRRIKTRQTTPAPIEVKLST
jgi:hypothetical protein